MKTATQRTSVSSTERWSTVTPSSPWWPSSKPWSASRLTTATLREWWDVHPHASPGPQTDAYRSRHTVGRRPQTVLILNHMCRPQTSVCSPGCCSRRMRGHGCGNCLLAATHRSAATPLIHHPQSLFPCSPSCSTLKLSGARASTSFSKIHDGTGLRAKCCYHSIESEISLYSLKTSIDSLQIQLKKRFV